MAPPPRVVSIPLRCQMLQLMLQLLQLSWLLTQQMSWLLTQQMSSLQPRLPTVRARPKAERRRPKADLMRVDALGAFRRPGHRPAGGRRPT